MWRLLKISHEHSNKEFEIDDEFETLYFPFLKMRFDFIILLSSFVRNFFLLARNFVPLSSWIIDGEFFKNPVVVVYLCSGEIHSKSVVRDIFKVYSQPRRSLFISVD